RSRTEANRLTSFTPVENVTSWAPQTDTATASVAITTRMFIVSLLRMWRFLGCAIFTVISCSAENVSTFSIVAYDAAAGDWGVAVASRYFSVGSVVPWAEAGVGAVATQANVNVGYGPKALKLLEQGLTAKEVLKRLLDEDTFDGKDGR